MIIYAYGVILNQILVIGTASLDILHLNLLQPPQTVYTVGGAGLYTALAAAKAGARTHFVRPQTHHMPPSFTTCRKTNPLGWPEL